MAQVEERTLTGPPAAAGDTSVRDELDRALRRALVEVDAEIWKNPARLRAVLKDLCAARGLYIEVLYQVAEFGVATALAQSRASGTAALSSSSLRMQVKRLTEKSGLSDDLAEWGVRTWGTALGLELVPERRTRELALPAAAPPAPLPQVRAPSPATVRSSRRVPSRVWAAAAALAVALLLGGVYALSQNEKQSAPIHPQPAAGAEPTGLRLPPGGWADPSLLARLVTVFVGHRVLRSGYTQTVVLEIRAVRSEGERGSFAYVLNEDRQRRDNTGTLWLADGRVDLPDLGTGRLGLDASGRPSLMEAVAVEGSPPKWRLRAVR